MSRHPHPLRPLDAEPRALRYRFDRPDQDREQRFGSETTEQWRARMHADNRAALTEPLSGIELGDYDHRILTWMAGWDIPTVATLASLLHRARAAAPLTDGGAR